MVFIHYAQMVQKGQIVQKVQGVEGVQGFQGVQGLQIILLQINFSFSFSILLKCIYCH